MEEMNRETAEAAVAQETAEDKTEAAAVEKAEVVSETDKEKETEEIGTKETMEDYSKELEASFRTIREGDIISGSVIDVNEEGVTLDLNYYASGVIKAEDMSKDPSFSIMADVHVGDVIEATVVKRDDGAGNIQLSRVEAADVLGWDKVQKYLEEKTVVNVKVAETVNKGVVAFLEGIRGFIPASHLSLSYVEDLNTFVGKELEVHVITVEKGKKKLVLSAREVLKEKEAEALNHRIAMVVPGTVMEGKVESIMPYGAFVEIEPGVEGLVHVSEAAAAYVKDINEVLHAGDEVTVKIMAYDEAHRKTTLSIRACLEEEKPAAKAKPAKKVVEESDVYSEKPDNNVFAELLKKTDDAANDKKD